MYKLSLSIGLLLSPGFLFGESLLTRIIYAIQGAPTIPTMTKSMTGRDIADLIVNLPDFIGTVSHELGHAAASALLFNDCTGIDVHINRDSLLLMEDPYLIKIRNMFIYSFEPRPLSCCVASCSWYSYLMKNNKEDKYKRIISLAAGPLAGMAASVVIALGFKKMCSKLGEMCIENNKLEKRKVKNFFIVFAALFGIYWIYGSCKGFINNFLNLTPAYGPRSDGYKIGRLLGVSQKTLDRMTIF